MLAEPRVIAQTVISVVSLAVLFPAVIYSVQTLRFWNIALSTERQTALERKNFLISTIVKYIILFQLVNFLLFLITVNIALPLVIKGAMCASGILSLNSCGYPLLAIKIFNLILSTVFIFLNHLDNHYPDYPLTPVKFRIVPPMLVLFLAEFSIMILFFSNISADVVATCCSVSFDFARSSSATSPFLHPNYLSATLLAFYVLALVMPLFLFHRKVQSFALFPGIFFLAAAVLTLKFHFVKFIYALPSHNCLFDIFWKQYYYIGYLLFALLFILLVALLLGFITGRLRNLPPGFVDQLGKRLRLYAAICLILYTLIVSAFWLYWRIFRL